VLVVIGLTPRGSARQRGEDNKACQDNGGNHLEPRENQGLTSCRAWGEGDRQKWLRNQAEVGYIGTKSQNTEGNAMRSWTACPDLLFPMGVLVPL
jgi:hypothetical protein